MEIILHQGEFGDKKQQNERLSQLHAKIIFSVIEEMSLPQKQKKELLGMVIEQAGKM